MDEKRLKEVRTCSASCKKVYEEPVCSYLPFIKKYHCPKCESIVGLTYMDDYGIRYFNNMRKDYPPGRHGDIVIRKPIGGDGKMLMDLRYKWLEETFRTDSDDGFHNNFDTIIDSIIMKQCYIVVDHGPEDIVGIITYQSFASKKECRADILWIHEKYRRQGLATSLLDKLPFPVKNTGVILSTSKPFWDKLGIGYTCVSYIDEVLVIP